MNSYLYLLFNIKLQFGVHNRTYCKIIDYVISDFYKFTNLTNRMFVIFGLIFEPEIRFGLNLNISYNFTLCY